MYDAGYSLTTIAGMVGVSRAVVENRLRNTSDAPVKLPPRLSVEEKQKQVQSLIEHREQLTKPIVGKYAHLLEEPKCQGKEYKDYVRDGK